MASLIFLRILQATLAGADERGFRCRRAWLAPAFGVPLLTFYCAFGDILSNLIWCGMMIVLSYCAIRGVGIRQWADGRGAEYAVVSHRGAVLCCLGISALDGGLLLAGYFPGKPRLLVRYAADADHFGAAARCEKGGGRMTYIENIFLCMVSPLLVAALCMGRRQLRFFLFCIAGMGVCLLSAYINTFLAAVCQADALAATAEIAPVVEEIMKLLPLVFYLLVFEPEGEKIKPTAITVALAFATFENVCYLIQNGANRFSFIFFRGFGTGAIRPPSLRAAFWRLSNFLKNFAFWVRVFSIFCTYISERVFSHSSRQTGEEAQAKCTTPQDGSHSSSIGCGKTPAGGSGARQ